ncbi:MAG: hypothetical protein RLO50_04930 [Azospirillaceae bacterium]
MQDTINTINALLARDLAADTREELTEILKSAEAGKLDEVDENYVQGLARRLGAGGAKPAPASRRKPKPGGGDAALKRDLAAAEARITALQAELESVRAAARPETGMVPLYAVKAAFERYLRPALGEAPEDGSQRPVDEAADAFYREIESLET